MGKALRVLIVEDSENDALRLIHELSRGDYEPVFSRVDTAETMKAALEQEAWDLVIADYTLTQFIGLACAGAYANERARSGVYPRFGHHR